MIGESLVRIVKGESLSAAEMEETMGNILDGRVSPAQISAFVTALRSKGETVEEIVGAARALASRVQRVNLSNNLLDIERDDINVESETVLATGDIEKSTTKTFNVSTATAFVLAGGGVKVVRHGNRSQSMYFGAADVLVRLGLNLDLTVPDIERSIEETGIGFLFTPIDSGPMRHVAPVREEIGIRTIFNLIGPLTNPAGASTRVLGVYKPSLTEKMAHVLNRLGARKAFVTYGEGTRDEISICGPTHICRLVNGHMEAAVIEPGTYGFEAVDPAAIAGGNAEENARIIRTVLEGEAGPKRNIVVLNAAAGFVAAGKDEGLVEGIKRAEEVIDSGAALEKLNTLIQFTNDRSGFVRKEL